MIPVEASDLPFVLSESRPGVGRSQAVYEPRVFSTLNNSLAGYFVSLLPRDPRIERVYWSLDGTLLTVWTVIDIPDGTVQQAIYSAELRFMKTFPELDCDFTVLYRFGRPEDDIRPAQASMAPHG